MESNIKNFSELEKLIKENPKEADAKAFEWQQFLKANAPTSPELTSLETSEEFYKWAKEHPEKNIDPSIWMGKEISEAYYYLRDQHENEQMQQTGNVGPSSTPKELVALPFLAASFLERPKIMEEDKDYQKIEEKLKKEWLLKNPGKDFLSKEGIDYLYGSLDDPTKLHLAKESERIFRDNPKFKKRVERYDKEKKKIYKNPDDDPSLRLHNAIAETHTNARIEYLKTHDDIKTSQEIASFIRKKSQEDFAVKFPEKSKVYSQKIEGLQGAQEAKYVEKKKREQSSISPSDANRILEEISKARENLPPEPTRVQIPESFSRPSPGLTQRGVSNAGRAGSRAVGQAGRAAAQAGRVAAQTAARGLMAFLATPPGWITLGVIAGLLIIVFLIVFIKGRDKYSSEINAQETISATPSPAVPIETPTPTVFEEPTPMIPAGP